MTAQPNHPPRGTPIRTRVVSVEEIAADMRIYRLDGAGAPPHRAGQYAFIHADGFDAREFSIASSPHSKVLEFHVKSTGKGGLSDHLFATWRAGSEALVSLPYGEHYWRPSERPLLALAGGVGVAPLKAILEAHFAHGSAAPAHLYWGVRDATHLYLDNFFRALAAKHPEFRYVPLVAEAGAGAHRAGFVGPAVQHDFKGLAGFSTYIAGPRPMVEATLPVLLQLGAEKDWLFSDAFKVGL